MGKIKKILSIFVIAISLFILSTIKVNAASGTISISSNKSQIVVGNTVTFTVKVTSPKYLVALQYNISYDSSMLTLTSGESSGAPVFSGNGVKSKTYTFKFKAKKSGTATFKFYSVGAAMENDEEINFSSKSKSIKIITQAQLEDSYSKNNNLSSLNVEGYSISPSFSSSITSYTVNLPANTEEINITGKKADSKATIEGLGKKSVEDGNNTIKITVTAENGSTKTYTINAIVEELDPINVIIDENEYTIVRKSKLLTAPNNDFIENSITINENQIPTLFNEKINITLVGLKDKEGNIKLYIYDKEKNTYTKYNQYTFEQLTLYIEEKEIENYNKKEEININESKIITYTLKNDTYNYFYAINLETGKENIYRYDKDENTVQKHIIETTNEDHNNTTTSINEQTYHYIILGLLGFIFLTYIIILLNLIFKGNNKKNNNNNKNNKENKKNEIKNIETLEKDEQIEDNKVPNLEKEKFIKETEEEINRIKNINTNETDEVINTINEVLDNKEKNKKRKKRNKRDKTI